MRRKGEGLSGRVWESGKTIPYEDVNQYTWLPETILENVAHSVLLGVGSGVCVPIREAASSPVTGTLHVHKRNRKALSLADIQFVEAIAKIAATGLKLADRTEKSAMELKLEWAVDKFMADLLRGAHVTQSKVNCYAKS